MTKFRQLLGYEFKKITNMQGGLMIFRLWVLVLVAGLASLHGGQGISARAGGAFLERQETGVFSFQTDVVALEAVQQGYAYTLNKVGHRTEVSKLGGRSLVFDYDKLYRLKNEAITGSVDGKDGSVGYTLDAVGNRLSRTTTGISLSEVLPSQSFADTQNDLLSNHQHDANGSTVGSNSDDVTSDVVTDTDVYDFRGKLVRRTKADGTVVDCWYAADGARVRKFVRNGAGVFVKNVRYLVCSNNHTGYAQVLEERDDAGSLLVRYLYGHDLVARESSGGLRSFYSYDGHGSVRGVTGSNGLVEEEFDYDAFGVLLGAREWDDVSGQMVGVAEPLSDGYFYSGERWDSDLGMYYLRARYLNAGSGRFHTMDDYEGRRGEPQSLHKYLYAHSNPLSYVDPSGNNISARGFATAQKMMSTLANASLRSGRIAYRVGKRLMRHAYKPAIAALVALNIAAGETSQDWRTRVAVTFAIPYNLKLIQKLRKRRIGSVEVVRIARSLAKAVSRIAKAEIVRNKTTDIGVFGISYKGNGLPDFSRFSRKTVSIKYASNTVGDFSRANRKGRRVSTTGYTWHHHEVVGVMELIPTPIHVKFGHDGGVLFFELLTGKPHR